MKPFKPSRLISSPIVFCLVLQLALVAVVLAVNVFTSYLSPKLQWSFVIGAAIYMVANAYFTFYAFRYRASASAIWALRSMNRGESGKFALTIMGFALCFHLGGTELIDGLALMVGFVAMVLWQIFIARGAAAIFTSPLASQKRTNAVADDGRQGL